MLETIYFSVCSFHGHLCRACVLYTGFNCLNRCYRCFLTGKLGSKPWERERERKRQSDQRATTCSRSLLQVCSVNISAPFVWYPRWKTSRKNIKDKNIQLFDLKNIEWITNYFIWNFKSYFCLTSTVEELSLAVLSVCDQSRETEVFLFVPSALLSVCSLMLAPPLWLSIV